MPNSGGAALHRNGINEHGGMTRKWRERRSEIVIKLIEYQKKPRS